MHTIGLKGSHLSLLQTRLWHLQKLNPDIYRAQVAVCFAGPLERSILLHALQRLVERHEILHTIFHTVPGMVVPVQVVTDASINCILLDAETDDETAQDAHGARVWEMLSHQPYDFAQGPLLRTVLLRLSSHKHLFFFSLPTLCADAATLRLCMAELCDLYAELAQERNTRNDDDILQYADVSSWLEELIADDEAEAQRIYWQREEVTQPISIRLSSRQHMARVETYTPMTLRLTLSEELVQRCVEGAQHLHVTLPALLLSCWNVLLWRLSAESRIVVGVISNGRHYEELLQAPGLYARAIPLASDFIAEQPFTQVVARIQQELEEGTQWQEYFIWDAQQKSDKIPTFSLGFEYEEWEDQQITDQLSCMLYKRALNQEPFIIKLTTSRNGQSMQWDFVYDSTALDVEDVQRIGECFTTCVEDVLYKPEQTIASIRINSQQKEKHLLEAFSLAVTAMDLPAQSSLPELFEQQAELTPNRIAVVHEHEQITYGALNAQANRLARALQEQGIGANILVGLVMKRSITMIVGLLAILKTAGAYVPLDPDVPPLRLTQIMQEITEVNGQAHILTQEKFRERFTRYNCSIYTIDATEYPSLPDDASNLNIPIACDNICYVIYTSGSTGVPKGVAIRHESVTNYTRYLCGIIAQVPGSSFATVSTLAADLGNTMIFCALASGGSLHVLAYETITSVERLLTYISQQPIDVLKMVPTHLSALMNTLSATEHRKLLPRKYLLLGGETLPIQLVQQIQNSGCQCSLYNHYGPTETTIGSLLYRIDLSEQATRIRKQTATVPIGQPIANTEIYILDQNQRIVPVEVVGDLYIGGAGLAQGYMQQPGQTAERFVPHPFRAQARLYYTGDLAYYNRQGEVELLGRADTQVKMRGYRIELREIENVLLQHESIRDCIVLLRSDSSNEPTLVAYLLTRKAPIAEQLLRNHLQQYLPEYMLPATLLFLDEFPLTRNGKVDRQALASQEIVQANKQATYKAPRNPLEELLLGIWEETLQRKSLGIFDNFFALGGHSLLATHVLARIRAILEIDLPIVSIFEQQNVAALAAYIEAYGQTGEHLLRPRLGSHKRPQAIPLSFAQQRLWFLQQLDPNSAAYNKTMALRLTGNLRREILVQSLISIVQRHETLRTIFQTTADQEVCQIIKSVRETFEFQYRDLMGLEKGECDRVVQDLITQEQGQAFNLEVEAPLRIRLLRLNKQEHILLFVMHHVASDGWSNDILLRELAVFYEAYAQECLSPLVPLSVQYADFTLWQRAWLQGQALHEQEDYWRTHLAELEPLELPTDFARPAIQRFDGGHLQQRLGYERSQRWHQWSLQEGVTLFMSLLAAWQVLLSRLSGQQDIAVGTPIANRQEEQVESLIGFFVNTLVLRTDLSGAPTFRQIVRRVRELTLQAYAHQDLPFEYLVELLQPERDPSRAPLIQHLFVFQQQQPALFNLGTVQVQEVASAHESAKFDLTLTVVQTAEGELECSLEYAHALFTETHMQQLLEQWTHLLDALLEYPDHPLYTLSLLRATEYQQLLQLSQEAPPLTAVPPLLQRWQQQVVACPQRVAVQQGEQQLSYLALDTYANQFAQVLRHRGVEQEHIVAIQLERSLWQIITVLAILKAGGAYVPIDAALPQIRQRFLLENSGAQVMVSSHVHDTQIWTPALQHWLTVEKESTQIRQQVTTSPVGRRSTSQLCYVLYTSGSTGEPKGVAMPETALCHLLAWQQVVYPLPPGGRVLQYAPLSFDVSFQELFTTLTEGGTLILLDTEETRRDPQALCLLLQREAVQRVFLPVVALRHLADSVLAGTAAIALETLREVFTAGEALQITPAIQHLFTQFPAIRLINQYGPTEAHVVANHPLPIAPGEWPDWPAIGRPIIGTHLLLCDAQGQLALLGSVGELSIGGAALARGYVGRADLTAERFIPDFWSEQPGARLYRTGDLARWGDDGRLHFVGRGDQQVKIRGYRVELAEIEAVLARHSGISASVVLIQEPAPGDQRLVAYIVVGEAGYVTEEEIRTHVQRLLPEYMVPSHIVLLTELPLNAHGKVQRNRLPQVRWNEVEANADELRTPAEEMVAGVWQQVLQQPVVGRQTNFFTLGGHSLLATQVISRLRRLWAREIPLRWIFEAPTVAQLAQRLDALVRETQVGAHPALEPQIRPAQLPLSFAQQRLWFLAQWEPEISSYHLPLAVRLRGALQAHALAEAFTFLVTRHESLRTHFALAPDGEPMQVIEPIHALTLACIDLHGMSPETQQVLQQHLMQQEAAFPFDLTQGPLLRTYLVRLGPQDHLLLLTLHHIVADGWSLTILVRELSAAYQASLQGQYPPFAPLPVQYADFTLWQRAWLQGQALHEQEDYWRTHLAELEPLELPTDFARPAIQRFDGGHLQQRLGYERSQRWHQWSLQEGVTLFMSLLAAWQVLLSRLSGQQDIAVGTPIANRQEEQVESLIGFFVNTLVLRTDLSGAPTFREIVRRVRELTLQAYAHQDLPFEYLVERLQPERDPSRAPLFQSMFVLQNTAQLEETFPGLIVEDLAIEVQTAKFDLTLIVTETAEGELECTLEYARALFTQTRMQRLLGQWILLLDALLTQPDHSITTLPLLTSSEQTALLAQAHSRRAAAQEELPDVATEIGWQVLARPDHIAVVTEQGHLSYAALAHLATSIARHLRDAGVGPEVVVGLYTERESPALAGLLAIWMVGGVVLPLDPNWPVARLHALLAETQTSLLLCTPALHASLPTELSLPTLLLQPNHQSPQEHAWSWGQMTQALQPLALEQAAYILYTSGSTGQPKGVLVRQRGLVNLLATLASSRHMHPDEHILQAAAWSFDISLADILSTWWVGARLVLASQETMQDLHHLHTWIREQAVTALRLTAAVLRQVPAHDLEAVQQVTTGGEVWHPEDLLAWLDGRQLYNEYGPTETTITAMVGRWHAEQSGRPGVGHPIAGVEGYVVDDAGSLLPPGIIGELLIGGVGLGRGYVAHADWTAQSFVPHPWSRFPGERLYRTGDRAQWREDGTLEIMGRRDGQVKVRGHRVELAEVEAAVRAGSQGQACLVRLRGSGERQFLVAYVEHEIIQQPQEQVEVLAQLREAVTERLPAYMQPQRYVLLTHFPLKANGKLDEQALPWEQEPMGQVEETHLHEARSPQEQALAEIWQEVLGRSQRIGVHENFFALGGHSLLATQVISRLRKLWGREIPLRWIFEVPTIAQLAQRLTDSQAEFVANMPPLVATSHGENIPLSFAQQRLWFLHQMDPSSVAYNMPMILRLQGIVDLPALYASLAKIVQRHESLRTTFFVHGQQPMQRVSSLETFVLRQIDLSTLPALTRELVARKLAEQEALCPFDLTRDPLMRPLLLHLEYNSYILCITIHHIAADGWSMGNVFLPELASLYNSFVKRTAISLSALPVQYSDFAVWQRTCLQGTILETHLAYWREQLAGVQPLTLPMRATRPAHQSFRGSYQNFTLSPALSQELRTLCQHQGVTLFMALLAAFQILLMRYSGQEDIVVGTPIANRNRAETEPLIGFFINTLVLRADLSGDPLLLDVLHQVRERALGAYAHQDLPFELLIDEIKPDYVSGQNPLFQILFQQQNIPHEELSLPGLNIQLQSIFTETSKFDLVFSFIDDPLGIVGRFGYSTDLFVEETITGMVQHFQTLLESLVAQPDQRISELALLQADEVQHLLERNLSSHLVPQNATSSLHTLFEEQAAQMPDTIAVSYKDEGLTYGYIQHALTLVARQLRQLGVRSEALVGLCVEPSPLMIIGILGILKAGGAYVPLDPHYPAARLKFLLADAHITFLLTEQKIVETLPIKVSATLYLDTLLTLPIVEEKGIADDEFFPDVQGENLAYVIYTSGSTGQPKGVGVTHNNVVRLFSSMHSWFTSTENDVWTMFHSFAFDFSVWEIWGALLSGGRLVMVPYWQSRSPQAFFDLLLREQVTVLSQTPSAFYQLQPGIVESNASARMALRWVIFGGEALDLRRLLLWYKHNLSLQVQLVNMYGITETTVHVTKRLLVQEDVLLDRGSVIGEPLDDLQAYILDVRLHPVPVGVPGELYVGGAGLARGYLGQPALSAQRFIPHPFSTLPGLRLYKTGDLARYTLEGDIEYLGRTDAQIKIRGFRIEVGEIEATLATHPEVMDIVVDVYISDEGTPNADKNLIAYIVSRTGQTLHSEELIEYVQQRLPAHMVPASFVQIDKIPLTAHGKVDRAEIKLYAGNRLQTGTLYRAPTTPLEQHIAELWCQLLHIEKVGLDDNFFTLGGDSIRAAIFINQLQEALGEIVHVVTLFDAPTIEGLNHHLTVHYRESVVRQFSSESLAFVSLQVPASGEQRLDSMRIKHFKELIDPVLLPHEKEGTQNPPMIFILAPPRSGTTLLRVMLEGHPALFSPPELELLSFQTLEQRKALFSGRDSFWLEGTVRALMEIKGCSAEQAGALMGDFEQQHWSTRRFYGQMQEWLGDRLLVDKTPSYSLSLEVLQRAEAYFANARYIHLVRHPYAMIHSFEEAKLEQIFFRHSHPYTRRELAELIWVVSQQNILKFLQDIPAERQKTIRFEELVRQPEPVMQNISDFLGLTFDQRMVQPYQSRRMTDGPHKESRMLGDVKFLQHQKINAQTAEHWQKTYTHDFLGEITWQIAEHLGYERRYDKNEGPHTTYRPAAVPMLRRLPDSERQVAPLSFAQQRLWFLDQMENGQAPYNIPITLRLRGKLDSTALIASFGALVQRHESLRTSFHTGHDGQPVQRIEPIQPIVMPMVDLSALSAEHIEGELRRCSTQHSAQSFDLVAGRLLHLFLLRCSAQEHVLLLNIHHIIADGWSMGIFIQDLAGLYLGFTTSKPASLPMLPVQYIDYSVWQRQWLQQEILDQQIAYWQRQLVDSEPLALPLDYPRPAMQTYHGQHERLLIPARICEQARRLSQQEQGTLFTLLLTAFQVLLMRYSGQTRIAVGTSVANRQRAELEQIIGFFVNTLVLRSNFSHNPTFMQALRENKRITQEAYANQDVPFEKLVEVLQPIRDLSRSPLFQVMFELQNLPPVVAELSGLVLTSVENDYQITKFDLSLSMKESEQGLHCIAEYNSDLFERATIVRLLIHWQQLLDLVTKQPELHCADLTFLSTLELHQLLETWNATQSLSPTSMSYHKLFEQQVQLYADSIAVVEGEHQLSYTQLNAQADQVALALSMLGVENDQLVGLLMDRSLAMLVCILGIFKAGGAYVPLDLSYPVDRLRLILQDTSPIVVIAHTLDGTELLEQPICSYAELFVQKDSVDGRARLLQSQAHQDKSQLAYVIHTSGSTGIPKGVMITQQGMLNHLSAKITDLHIGNQERIAQTASHCFDISVWQFLAALLCGGQVNIYTQELVTNAPAFLTRLQEDQITILEVVPSFLRVLLSSLKPQERSLALRWLLVTGEAFPIDVCKLWLQMYPQIPLVNAYGPTECSDDITHCFIYEQHQVRGTSVSIGHALANTQLYVLDEYFKPVPIGVVGQLYVGGRGLARGYWRNALATAQTFIPHPFAKEGGERLYCTGDLVRYRPDSQLDFLGRVDQQVKIRGYRIELEEIEVVLNQLSSVRECVVVVQEKENKNQELVAYIVFQNESGPADRELRQYLELQLPAYMLPTQFVSLSSLPLTANGKVDRASLPEPRQQSASSRYAETQRPLEELLSTIWCGVLQREHIDVQENFFAAGGHSLLAMQLVTRINATLQIHMPLRSIFEQPTVTLQAQTIERLLREQQKLPTSNIIPIERTEPQPLSFAQQRLWFLYKQEPESGAFNVPLAISMYGHLQIDILHHSLLTLAERHESLRTTFTMIDGQPRQVIGTARKAVTLIKCDLSALPPTRREHEARVLLNRNARTPFDLAHAALRCLLIRLDKHEYRLSITMHHIITDGWSLGIFLHEWISLYNARIAGDELSLATLPVQYADFAVWQRQWLQGEVLHNLSAYWHKQLGGKLPLLEIPTDMARSAVRTYRGATVEHQFTKQLTETLKTLNKREEVTLFMTLLSTFQILLYRITGQDDVIVGTDVAGRNHLEIEGIIGFFINQLVLRTRFAADLTFREALQRVRMVTLEAYTHQDLPFDKLVEMLNPERSSQHTPLFQVKLILQNPERDLDAFTALEVQPLAADEPGAQFDLILSCRDGTQGLQISYIYNRDLFEQATIQRLAMQLEMILEQGINQPEVRLGQIDIVTSAERREQERLIQEAEQTRVSKLKAVQTEPIVWEDGEW